MKRWRRIQTWRAIAAVCSFIFGAISCVFEVFAVWVVMHLPEAGSNAVGMSGGAIVLIPMVEWLACVLSAAICAGIGLAFAHSAKNRGAKILAYVGLFLVFLWVAYIVFGLIDARTRTGRAH
jgi:hypothetical protein